MRRLPALGAPQVALARSARGCGKGPRGRPGVDLGEAHVVRGWSCLRLRTRRLAVLLAGVADHGERLSLFTTADLTALIEGQRH